VPDRDSKANWGIVRDKARAARVLPLEVTMQGCRLASLLAAVSFVALAALGGCDDVPSQPASWPIDSVVIDRSGLPDEFDSLTTFTYQFPSVNAESVLVALLEDDLSVRYGWRPLDNLCLDPIGPRFTVQLRQDDPRILKHDFVRGAVGRLLCATQLMRYQVRAGR
jgi:hypothetical protein